MKYQDNIAEVASLGPDYLGFIFYEKSARFFNSKIPQLPDSIKKVGIFVNAAIEDILENVKKHDLQLVQLHGEETPEYCEQLKKSGIKIIKVFSIKDHFDFEQLSNYESVCDYYLFDTKGKLPGGNGFTFNWNVLKNYPSNKPYFLSGGIGNEESENIKSFLKTNSSKYCYAIDANSKFEIEAGLKDVIEIKRFKLKLEKNIRT